MLVIRRTRRNKVNYSVCEVGYMATYIADRYILKKKEIGGGNMASIHLCEDTDIDDD